jgi:hypothetical protein
MPLVFADEQAQLTVNTTGAIELKYLRITNIERSALSVDRELCRPEGAPWPLIRRPGRPENTAEGSPKGGCLDGSHAPHSAPYCVNAEEDMFNVMELNNEAPYNGEVWRLCRGYSTRHAWREVDRNLRGPVCSAGCGMPDNKQGGWQTVYRESDLFIVLGERASRSHALAMLRCCRQGEGISSGTQHPQERNTASKVMLLKSGTSAGKNRPGPS